MSAYYRNGKLYFHKKKKTYERILFIVCIISVIIMFVAASFDKADYKHSCGIEIPGIENQKFCIGYDNGVYYDNDKLRVQIK